MKKLFITYKCHHDRTCTHIGYSKVKENKNENTTKQVIPRLSTYMYFVSLINC